MGGLPKDIDLTSLNGRSIEVLWISKYQVHFFLNDDMPHKPDVWIEIGGTVIVTDRAGNTTEIDNYRTNGGLLCLLLGLSIGKSSRRDDGGLLLEMSDRSRLEVPIDTPMYESVVLNIGDNAIIG